MNRVEIVGMRVNAFESEMVGMRVNAFESCELCERAKEGMQASCLFRRA